MLLVCISTYLKSVLKYKFLNLNTFHPHTLYLCEDESIGGYFLKLKVVHKQKILGNSMLTFQLAVAFIYATLFKVKELCFARRDPVGCKNKPWKFS